MNIKSIYLCRPRSSHQAFDMSIFLDDDKRIHTCAKVGPWHILLFPVENTTFFVGTISSNGVWLEQATLFGASPHRLTC